MFHDPVAIEKRALSLGAEHLRFGDPLNGATAASRAPIIGLSGVELPNLPIGKSQFMYHTLLPGGRRDAAERDGLIRDGIGCTGDRQQARKLPFGPQMLISRTEPFVPERAR